MGVGTIMESRKILLLANSKKKADGRAGRGRPGHEHDHRQHADAPGRDGLPG